MKNPTDKELESVLINAISDGFNRSIGALVDAKAIDTKKMRTKYRGIGSEYYDLVTDEIVFTAKNAIQNIRKLFMDESENKR